MIQDNHKAAELSFDLSKQFISIAFAGVAFAVGLSASNGKILLTLLFWIAVFSFALSAILGFFFLMRGASDLSQRGSFDIYQVGARWMSLFQIIFVFLGVVLLLILHLNTVSQNSQMQILINEKGVKVTPEESMRIDVDKNGVIKIYRMDE